MTVAIKKILYAADAKESALEEAQEYLSEAINTAETEVESEAWLSTSNGILPRKSKGFETIVIRSKPVSIMRCWWSFTML